MALQDEQVVDIPGLNGEEIITDLCDQIAGKLRKDCNLRPQDSYVNGYSAEVTVKVHCFGIDTAEVESKFHASKAPTEKIEGAHKTKIVESEIHVAHEPDLTLVRERSEQTAPNVERKHLALDAEEKQEEAPAPSKRKYGSPRTAAGGAGSFDE